MTIEEAIRIIKIVLAVAEDFEITVRGEEFTEEKCKEAVDMAIKALQQEPRWIPVSERLPDDHDWYVIVVKEKSTGYQYIPRIASYIHDNCWSIIDTEDADKDWLDDLECVAWMPLPEPYKASPTEQGGKNERNGRGQNNNT